MDKTKIIRMIVDIDVRLNNDLYDRKMTADQRRKLRAKRDRLEKKLHK